MRRAPGAANNVMCERVGQTERGAHNRRHKGSPLRKGRSKKMRTKKKIAMMVALAVVVLVALVCSGPAMAQKIWGVIQCDSDPCNATGAHEVVFEQVGNGVADNMYAQGGHDNLRAQNYTNDNDTANGGPGFDRCVVDATVEASNTCDQVVVR